MTMSRMLAASAAFVSLASFGGAAAAQTNLVANPSFETGSFSSWTNEDTVAPTNNRVIGSNAAPDGAFIASLGSTQASPLLGINQNIATTAGANYTFSFYVRGDALTGNGFSNQAQAYFGNEKVYDVTNLANTGFQLQAYNVTATSATTNIRFAVNDQNNFIGFDNIVVRAAAATPEPATWSLMILGFGIVGNSLRRQRRLKGKRSSTAMAI